MTSQQVAILGGDRRELRIARRLLDSGHKVTAFGAVADSRLPVEWAASSIDAVNGATWIVCPSPGLGAGDVVYAPASSVPIVLDEALLRASSADSGGVILGRATPTVAQAAQLVGVRLYEMKDDRSLAISNATAVAEAVLRLLIEHTEQVLPEHQILVLGYGATGSALTDDLLGIGCRVSVAARRRDSQERIRQRGARPVDFADRNDEFVTATVVVNTVPSVESLPTASFSALGESLVVDIASPPGGLDHTAARDAGLNVVWARALAGGRAPISVGDAQFRFIESAMKQLAPPERPDDAVAAD